MNIYNTNNIFKKKSIIYIKQRNETIKKKDSFSRHMTGGTTIKKF